MNEIESIFLILGMISIFIGVPTFCLCNCNKKNYSVINDINKDKYMEI